MNTIPTPRCHLIVHTWYGKVNWGTFSSFRVAKAFAKKNDIKNYTLLKVSTAL